MYAYYHFLLIFLFLSSLSLSLSLDYEPMSARHTETSQYTEVPSLAGAADTSAIYSSVATQEPTYANVEKDSKPSPHLPRGPPPFDPLIPLTCPVAVAELGVHVAGLHGDNNAGFNQQYQVIPYPNLYVIEN